MLDICVFDAENRDRVDVLIAFDLDKRNVIAWAASDGHQSAVPLRDLILIAAEKMCDVAAAGDIEWCVDNSFQMHSPIWRAQKSFGLRVRWVPLGYGYYRGTWWIWNKVDEYVEKGAFRHADDILQALRRRFGMPEAIPASAGAWSRRRLRQSET